MARENHNAGLHLVPKHYHVRDDNSGYDKYAEYVADVDKELVKKHINDTILFKRRKKHIFNNDVTPYNAENGIKVFHIKYGIGEIVTADNNCIMVRFDEDSTLRTLVYPDCFFTGKVIQYFDFLMQELTDEEGLSWREVKELHKIEIYRWIDIAFVRKEDMEKIGSDSYEKVMHIFSEKGGRFADVDMEKERIKMSGR